MEASRKFGKEKFYSTVLPIFIIKLFEVDVIITFTNTVVKMPPT